ncbi:MAG TPA: agmatinase [Hyphomicrobiaceae bacterium]|jgi:agmatinase|nr:agmatinase [Hyphomicrobiaceae bacterium]
MDRKKLEALRAKYPPDRPDASHHPEFKAAIETIFAGTDRRPKPYEGVTSFLGAPLRLDAAKSENLGGLDVALVGVPLDLGVTNRPGARFGPRAVRAVERIGPYHHVHRLLPLSAVKAGDIGDVPFRSRYSLDDSIEDIEALFARIASAGVTPLAVGGDHSITYPILKALGAHGAFGRPLGLVHIDAHCDTGAPFEGAKFHHGGPFRNAVLAGVLDPERTIQIGIRGGAEYLWEFSHVSGMTVLHAEEFARLGTAKAVKKIHEVVGDGPTYISFDIDSLDPAFAPGTGTPEIGGLTTREALELVRGCAGLSVIGGDVVEVAPQYDATTNTAQAAAQILFELLAVVALARSRGP